MIKTRTTLITAALWITAAAVSFAANAHMGTWKLDEAKSKLQSGSKNLTVTYAAARNDMVKLTADGMNKEGKATHWTWVGKFDGKSYKVKGDYPADMVAIQIVDDHTNKITSSKDGKIMFTSTVTVAKDGKSRMVVTNGTDAKGKKWTDKAYYAKQ
jgi:hypothetical protein